MNNKIIELARKIKELADRGVGGEKLNAIERLNFLMKKYNLSELDINGEERKDFDFDLKKEIPIEFVSQVLSSVVGRRSEYGCDIGVYKYVRKNGYISRVIRNIQPDHFSEFILKVDIHWEHYKNERELFYKAYIHKNHLYCKPNESESESENQELTQEEKEQYFKIEMMMQGIERKSPLKRIN